ncbi:hypothetical protein TNCV_4761571 [Trichonephila clavipes]|uniref:Uncharacterized protein n=1 Tax=Trichonephila clavipes TaxID=2585209 RepID=A0A8X6RE21_TRICX|nr:hypothetical protein TNCV_4761571 [Trichonephila clavipes]
MDPGNLNTLPDYSELRTQWNLKIQSSVSIIEAGEIMFKRQQKIFSLLHAIFIEQVSQYSSLEGNELEKIKADFDETEVLMHKLKVSLESMKKIQRQAKDKLEFINLHVSKHDCQNEVTEIKDLFNLFETTKLSFICANINQFRSAVVGLHQKMSKLEETITSRVTDE